MSDYFVKQSTDKLKADIARHDRETEAGIQKANAIKAHAPEQWKLLRQWIADYCEQANLDMGYAAFVVRKGPSSQLKIDLNFTPGAVSGRLLEIEFHEPTGTITYDNSRQKFSPYVDSSGFHFSDGSHGVTVEEMGQILVKILLDMR